MKYHELLVNEDQFFPLPDTAPVFEELWRLSSRFIPEMVELLWSEKPEKVLLLQGHRHVRCFAVVFSQSETRFGKNWTPPPGLFRFVAYQYFTALYLISVILYHYSLLFFSSFFFCLSSTFCQTSGWHHVKCRRTWTKLTNSRCSKTKWITCCWKSNGSYSYDKSIMPIMHLLLLSSDLMPVCVCVCVPSVVGD